MASQPIPVIATGRVFADYLAAARVNLANLARLAEGLNDTEFAREAQSLLDDYDACSLSCRELIAEANGEEMPEAPWDRAKFGARRAAA